MRNLKRALSLALASVMLLGMMVVGTSASYPDVDAQDNLEAIEVMQMLGVMDGDDKGNFNPDQKVTRNQMAVVMTHLMNLNLGGTTPFTDVPGWAEPFVAACYENGVVAGTSATTYGGNQYVTAAQAALMVMKALGYFGYAGEFGDDWQLATVKMATKIDLFAGINAAVTAPLTRNEVAQLVLNALESDVRVVTEVGGIDVETGDTSVTVKPSYNYGYAADKKGCKYDNVNDEILQLVEKLYGADVKKTMTDITDDWGRPATQWKYGKNTVTAPAAADLTYTVKVAGKTIAADLGKATVENGDIEYYQDGGAKDANKPAGFAIKAKNDVEVGGAGCVTEVYYDAVNAEAVVVVINSYVGKVTESTKNDDGKYDIKIDDMGEATFAFDENLDKDTYVVYTKIGTDIKSMYVAEKVEGEVTRIKDETNFVLDGETYTYAADIATAKLTNADGIDKEYKVFVDEYNNVVAVEGITADTFYAYVTAMNDGGEWEDDLKAKLLLTDGTIVTASIKLPDGTNAENYKTALVKYSVNSDNVYSLSEPQKIGAAATEDLAITNGKVNVTLNDTEVNYYANNKTVFFFKDGDNYSAATGYKNVVTHSAESGYKYAVIADSETDIIKAIVIVSDSDLSDTSAETAGFFFLKGDEKVIKDSTGSYYELKAVVDGKVEDIKFDATAAGDILGGALVNKTNTNDKGIMTNADEVTYTVTNGKGYINETETVKVADGVITLDSEGYACGDDAVIFEYKDGKFTAKAFEDLNDVNCEYFAQIDGNTVVSLFYIAE